MSGSLIVSATRLTLVLVFSMFWFTPDVHAKITTKLTRSGTLKIEGDRGDNSIRVGFIGSTLLVTTNTVIDGYSNANAATEYEFDAAEVKKLSVRGNQGNDGIVLYAPVPFPFYGFPDIRPFVLGLSNMDVLIEADAGDDLISIRNLALKNVAITTGKGDDNVGVADCLIEGDLSIKSHRGNDLVGLIYLDVVGATDVVTNSGDDFVVTHSSTFEDTVRLATGKGEDAIMIGEANSAEVVFLDDVSASMGTGHDELVVWRVLYDSNVQFDGDCGADCAFVADEELLGVLDSFRICELSEFTDRND